MEKYSGVWYVISRDWWYFFGTDCTTATYTPREDGMVTVQNDTYNFLIGDFSISGSAIASDTGDASLNVSLSDRVPSASDEPNYTVLSTDYETYLVVYSCNKGDSWYANDNFWVFSRTPTLSDDKMLEIIAIAEERLPSYDFFYNQFTIR